MELLEAIRPAGGPTDMCGARHRRLLVVIALATVLVSAPGVAQVLPPPPEYGQIHLAWENCHADGGASNRTFACDTNVGSATLVLSVTPPVDVPQFNGFDATLFVLEVDSALPNWWQMQTGGCRAGVLSLSFSRPAGASACLDPWQGSGIGDMSFQYPSWLYADVVGRLRVVAALSSGSTSLMGGQNYFLARVTMPFQSTTGAGACEGCASGVCVVFGGLLITQPLGAGNLNLETPDLATNSDLTTWQPGVVARRFWFRPSPHSYAEKHFECLSETETRRPTWGAIKRLYR